MFQFKNILIRNTHIEIYSILLVIEKGLNEFKDVLCTNYILLFQLVSLPFHSKTGNSLINVNKLPDLETYLQCVY